MDQHQIHETIATFGDRTRPRVGIVTQPRTPGDPATAALFLNAGFLHRVGPQRIYVHMARQYAEAGLWSVRFDFSGIGDSFPRADNLPMEEAYFTEAVEVMDQLEQKHGITRFVPIGLCSGADVAFRLALQDHRVTGAVVVNSSIGANLASPGANQHAKTQTQMRYYRKKLLNPKSIGRLLTFKSNYRKIFQTLRRQVQTKGKDTGSKGSLPDTVLRPLRELKDRNVAILAVYSEGSTAYDLFHVAWGQHQETLRKQFPSLTIETVADVDHVFTPVWSQDFLLQHLKQWLAQNGLLAPSPEGD